MVSSLAELMQVQAAITVVVLEAHHSSWNNQLRSARARH